MGREEGMGREVGRGREASVIWECHRIICGVLNTYIHVYIYKLCRVCV